MKRKTKVIKIGEISVGADNPIAVQSMLNAPADDLNANINQAKELAAAGCDIIRVAVPSMESVKLIDALKSSVGAPIVADIHYNYKIALECIEAGADKIRINPGNIGSEDRTKAVADACANRGIPIRIGVNSGSLEKEILNEFGAPTPEAMCKSAMNHIQALERHGFNDIAVSIKSSNVKMMAEAYRLVSAKCDYPLHLGVTEAGSERMGLIKSSIGIGSLLMDGIGDTIRVSLTADPVKEVFAGFDILKALELKKDCPYIISCPTCGRTKIDIIGLTKQVEERLEGCNKAIKVAVMGCAVNGPGEAKEADIGIAGGDKCALLFKKGEIIRKISEENIVDELMREIEMI